MLLWARVFVAQGPMDTGILARSPSIHLHAHGVTQSVRDAGDRQDSSRHGEAALATSCCRHTVVGRAVRQPRIPNPARVAAPLRPSVGVVDEIEYRKSCVGKGGQAEECPRQRWRNRDILMVVGTA